MKNLFLEIGNTNINYLLREGKKVVKKGKMPVCEYLQILTVVKKYRPQNVIIASVVPHVEVEFSRKLKKDSGIRVVKIGQDVIVPIRNRYTQPEKVGIDRLLNAYYIKEKFSLPAICIDLGTAITIDVISPLGEFCGGLIFPGVKLCYDVLGEKTSLLPHLEPQKLHPRTYGRNTEECLHLGIIGGISNLLDGVINNLSEKLARKYRRVPAVFITGGDATLLISTIRKNKWRNIPDLTLKAMVLLWSKLCKN